VSRFRDYDCDEEDFPGQRALQEANWQRALTGKRGRRFLALVREALMALPEHRLIEGALCTVGAADRRGQLVAQAEADAAAEAEALARRHAELVAEGRHEMAERIRQLGQRGPDLDGAESLDDHVRRDGEGVCANGALLWYLKTREGIGTAEAFAALPTLLDGAAGDEDFLEETARLAARSANVAASVAWEVAFRNDEAFRTMTPEGRWQATIRWIDGELAGNQPPAPDMELV
jgi:hypothetical protein